MSNLASLLSTRLSPLQHDLLKSASRAAEESGVELYLVGGSVRDLLLGVSPADLDVSVVAGDDEFALALAESLDGEVVSQSQFGTAKLRLDEASVDLVQARREAYSSPGALPTVEPGSLEDDLARRDFSINAMAVSLVADTWGEATDLFDGAADLERREINVLHPSSFRDDATRLFRAVRYAERLGFQLGPETERFARDGAMFVDTISGDRIRHELERIFEEERAVAILLLAGRLGLLERIHPSLRLVTEVAEALDRLETERRPAMLAGLAYSLSADEAKKVVSRLNLGVEWSRIVSDTIAVRESLEELESSLPPSGVHALLRSRHEAAISVCATVAGPVATRNLDLFLNTLGHVSPSLTGRDIVAMGVPEGPSVGELLRELLDARLDGLVDSTDGERAMVTRRVRETGL